MNNKLLRRLLLTALAVFSFTVYSGQAQSDPGTCTGPILMDYAFSQDVATYSTRSTSFNYTNTSSYYYSYWSVTLPFTFCYDQNPFTTVYQGGNANLMFMPYRPGNMYSYPYYFYDLYYGHSYYSKNYLYAWGAFLYGYAYTTTGRVGYKFEGSSPNRIAIFEWYNNVYQWNSTNPIDVQIQLHENGTIVYHYGKVACGYDWYMNYGATYGYWYYLPYIFLSGWDGNYTTSGGTNYISVYPPGTGGNSTWDAGYRTAAGVNLKGPNVFLNYPTIRSAAVVNTNWAQQGIRFTFGKKNPELKNVIPMQGVVLLKGSIYTGADHPAVFYKRESGMPAIKFRYRIYGPTETGPNIYQAKHTNGSIDVDPGNIIGDSARYNFTNAFGTGVCYGSGGTLDLQTNQSSFGVGQYYTAATLYIDQLGYFDYKQQRFNIAFNNDLALFVYSPRRKTDKRYPLATLPIQMEVFNFGYNDITEFEVFCTIWKDGVMVSKSPDTLYVHWQNVTEPLQAGKSVIVTLPPGFFPTQLTGTYEIRAWATLLSATDQDPASNIIPRPGDGPYEFGIVKEVDLKAVRIVSPDANNPVTVKRPMAPIARFTNQGVNDLDFDSVFFEIKYVPTQQVVYRDTVINAVLSAGVGYDTTNVTAKKQFDAQLPGEYQICARVVSAYDNNPASMKIACTNFTATGGLVGNYTVGQGQTYATIRDAVDDLYRKGVAGHVRFLLTDRNYTIGDTLRTDIPALDLSAYIPGIGPDATVSFIPSDSRAVERGGNNSGVTINVLTGSGYGILFGQNYDPDQPQAIVKTAPPSAKNKYSKSLGYMIWDGGYNKSIRFVLVTRRNVNQYFHNVVYMKQGSSNNQIKNCMFENSYKNAAGTSLTPHVFLPHLRTSGSLVDYMTDNYLSSTGYSAAIVLRTVAPKDISGGNTLYNLDTLTCNNNIISGNEITGF
ncbi:hypothetical protein D9V86_10480, partial [Bacteroidetes/Chlorobi group bacterium ChocPot_Mid]